MQRNDQIRRRELDLSNVTTLINWGTLSKLAHVEDS
jgi:hypothetical protein